MQLSIIIVNYNSKQLLENCIGSLQKAIQNIETEIIIVDNNSTDDSWEYIKSLRLTGSSFKMKENFGFATACNGGFGVSHGKYILFLNPDTIVPETSLADCISFFESHPDAGAIGVRMVDIQNKFLKESKRGLPTPAASFYKLFGLSAIFPKSKTFSKYYEGHLPEKENKSVEVLSGAFMMVRREVFEKVNGFDVRFFMYGEDIDLSIRILQAGYKNYYLGKVTVTHLKGGSTTYNNKYVQDFYGAMSLFVKKHYSNRSLLFRSVLYSGISVRKIIAKAGLLFNR
jgi:GT2 family glycosyltransferase